MQLLLKAAWHTSYDGIKRKQGLELKLTRGRQVKDPYDDTHTGVVVLQVVEL